jgi:hypothetical protein
MIHAPIRNRAPSAIPMNWRWTSAACPVIVTVAVQTIRLP